MQDAFAQAGAEFIKGRMQEQSIMRQIFPSQSVAKGEGTDPSS